MNLSIRCLLWILGGSSSMLLGGCLPATYVDVPAFHGRVIDAQSRPISGATIQITKVQDGKRIDLLTSGPDGNFDRPEQDHFLLYIPGFDFITVPYSVQATYQGFHSQTIEVNGGDLRIWLFNWSSPRRDVSVLTVKSTVPRVAGNLTDLLSLPAKPPQN